MDWRARLAQQMRDEMWERRRRSSDRGVMLLLLVLPIAGYALGWSVARDTVKTPACIAETTP